MELLLIKNNKLNLELRHLKTSIELIEEKILILENLLALEEKTNMLLKQQNNILELKMNKICIENNKKQIHLQNIINKTN